MMVHQEVREAGGTVLTSPECEHRLQRRQAWVSALASALTSRVTYGLLS